MMLTKQVRRLRAIAHNPRLLTLWLAWRWAELIGKEPELKILDCSFSGFADFNAYVGLAHAAPEWGEWQYITAMTARASTIVDVGANYGVFSCPLATRLRAAKIFAMEPHEPTCRTLVDNVRRNQLTNVIVSPSAASSVNGTVRFSDNLSAACNRIVQQADAKAKSVRSVRLDDFAVEHGIGFIDFLKIDTEGGDYDVLMGASKLFEEKKLQQESSRLTRMRSNCSGERQSMFRLCFQDGITS